MTVQYITAKDLAGEPILSKLTKAPGNDSDIGGLKVVTQGGWFAARPSGTEDICKICTESFRGEEHLKRIQEEAMAIVNAAYQQFRGWRCLFAPRRPIGTVSSLPCWMSSQYSSGHFSSNSRGKPPPAISRPKGCHWYGNQWRKSLPRCSRGWFAACLEGKTPYFQIMEEVSS